MRRLAHTNQGNFPLENTILRVSIKSHIKRDRVLAYSNGSIKESYDSQVLSIYKEAEQSGSSRKKTLILNEVSNFIIRHFSDQIVLSLHSKSEVDVKTGTQSTETCLFRTCLELNNLELNQDKMSITVVGTSPMRNKTQNSQLVYYTFELDLLFKVRL